MKVRRTSTRSLVLVWLVVLGLILSACGSPATPTPQKPAATTVPPAATATPEPTLTVAPPVEPAEPTATPAAEPGADELEMFVVTSIGSAQNGATSPTSFAITRPWLVTRIVTYHWNNRSGVEPGHLSLLADDGTKYGPWAAEGLPGQGGVPNAYWSVRPNEIIPAGGYTVIDSDPGTWSQNNETGGRGMAWGYGIPR